jgi:hypothetical protein
MQGQAAVRDYLPQGDVRLRDEAHFEAYSEVVGKRRPKVGKGILILLVTAS